MYHYVYLLVSHQWQPLLSLVLLQPLVMLTSPASDSTLGPTSGLNADGQHDHIWDSVVPTFIHYNLPLIASWLVSLNGSITIYG